MVVWILKELMVNTEVAEIHTFCPNPRSIKSNKFLKGVTQVCNCNYNKFIFGLYTFIITYIVPK